MLNWFQNDEDIDALIAGRRWRRAIRAIEKRIAQEPDSSRLHLMLADVLTRAGKKDRAIEVLENQVDTYAGDGFVAKAIAVLKRIQRIDPDRQDIDAKLASLIARQRGDGPDRSSSRELPIVHVGADTTDITPHEPTALDSELADLGTSELVMPKDWFLYATDQRDDFHWSPLFEDFSRQEMAAVIGGLRLLIKHPGAIIYTEGEPGDSLFILSTGAARVYRRDVRGHNNQRAVLQEGDFFGAASVLAGQLRDATVTAVTECELLELDRPTFDSIAESHPGVRVLVEKYYTREQP